MKQTALLSKGITIIAILLTLVLGCKKDEDGGPGPTPGPTPITENLFPLVHGNQYMYTGYLVDTNSVQTPAPGLGSLPYQTIWTLINRGDGTFLIKDSTNVGAFPSSSRFLQIKKDSAGSYWFRQTLGPFYRAIQKRGISFTYTDTLIWVLIVKPSVGVGGTWTAFDTTITGTFSGSPIDFQLTISGKIEYPVSVTDSTTAHTQHSTYLSTTTRTVRIGPTIVTTGAITGRFWLAKDIGPVQVNISGDTENYGHWRVMKSKNF